MITRLSRPLVSALMVTVILAATSIATASPYQPGQVSDEAKWVVHVDVKSFIASKYGKLVIDDLKEMGLQEKVDEVKTAIGIDPLLGWEGMTLYGDTYEKEQGVALIEVSDKKRDIKSHLTKKDGYKQLRHGKFIIHKFTETKKWKDKQKTWTSYVGEFREAQQDVLITAISKDLKQVQRALDTLAGTETSLSDLDEDDPMAAEPSAGSFMFVNGKGFKKFAAKSPKSMMFREAEHVTMDLGEHRGKVFADMTVIISDEKKAEGMEILLNGLLILYSMEREGDDPMAVGRELATKVKVGRTGSVISMSFEHESATLYKKLETWRDSMRKHWKAKRAAKQVKKD